MSEIGQDDFLSATAMREHLATALGQDRAWQISGFELGEVQNVVKRMTAWRLEGTLREFPKFEPVNLWFNHPLHLQDEVGSLKDLVPVGSEPPYKRGAKKGHTTQSSEEKKNARIKKNTENILTALDSLDMEGQGQVRIGALESYFGKSRNTIKNWIRESDSLAIDDEGYVSKLEKDEGEVSEN